jgi:hypothetical protein
VRIIRDGREVAIHQLVKGDVIAKYDYDGGPVLWVTTGKVPSSVEVARHDERESRPLDRWDCDTDGHRFTYALPFCLACQKVYGEEA